jgi:hypothetical protein
MKLGNLFKKKKKKDRSEDLDLADMPEGSGAMDSDRLMAMGDDARREAAEAAAIQEALAHAIPDGIEIKSKVKSDEGQLYFLVKVKNNMDEIMGDVKIAIAADKSIVNIPKPRKSVKFIDPGKSTLFRFPLRPTMACGKTEIEGLLRYFDFEEKQLQEYLIPEYNLNINYPDIKSSEVDEELWRIAMSRLNVFEIETIEMDVDPNMLFDDLAVIVENMGFYPLKPNIVPSLYRGIGKFYGLDPLKEPHCVEVQVIGIEGKTRLLFRTWAPTTTRAMGVAFNVIGNLDEKMDIKSNLVKKDKQK